jgi:hypothetical protein
LPNSLEGEVDNIGPGFVRQEERLSTGAAGIRKLPRGNLDVTRRVVELLWIKRVGEVELGLLVVGDKNHARKPNAKCEDAVAGKLGLQGEDDSVGRERCPARESEIAPARRMRCATTASMVA